MDNTTNTTNTNNQLVELFHTYKNKIHQTFSSTLTSAALHDVIRNKLNEFQGRLQDYETTITTLAQAALDSEEYKQVSKLLDDIMDYYEYDVSSNLPEMAWGGIVPISHQLNPTKIPYLVPKGEGGWSKTEYTFNLRGASYLVDEKKVPSKLPLFHIIGMQLFKSPAQLLSHVVTQPWSALSQKRPNEEWLILNYMVPGNVPLHVVVYFTASRRIRQLLKYQQQIQALRSLEGWEQSFLRFWRGNQDYCDEHFKMLPNLVEAPWSVQMAVGNKPALTGKKLRQQYHRGPGYLEIDIDISSSSIATGILSLVRGVSNLIRIDIGITIEGSRADELPERTLCQCRWLGVNLEGAPVLQEVIPAEDDESGGDGDDEILFS